MVRFKLRPKEPIEHSHDGKRFHDGIFLGIDRKTGQYVMSSDDGVKHARTILRVPDAEKWNRERLEKLTVTPKSLHVPREPEVIFKERPRKPEDEQPTVPKPIVARGIYVRP